MHILESSVESAVNTYFWNFKGHKHYIMTPFFQFNCKINIVEKCAAQVGHPSSKEYKSHYYDTSSRFF